MQQGGDVSPAAPTPLAIAESGILARLRGHLDALIDEVVHDVALSGEDREAVRRVVAPVVAWTLDALGEGEQLSATRVAMLHEEGRRAATARESLQRLLDRYLSTGWVVWGAATRDTTVAEMPALPGLGTALLKAGDAAAAAIATGYGEAERALALRAAGARRELMDELLDLAAGDADAAARVRRRAADFGLDPAAMYRIVVATFDHDVADGGPELEQVAAATAPPARPLPRRAGGPTRERPAPEPLVASRRGRLVVLVPTDGSLPATLAPALESVAAGPWLAVGSPAVVGLSRLADAYGTAIEALTVGARIQRTGLIDADAVLLERALLADEPLLAQAVEHELGPILRASRNARALLETLDVFLANAENLRATARRLGVAPRTVAYRMARIEHLLGERVRGARVERLATALLAARLLPDHALGPRPAASASDTARRPRRRNATPTPVGDGATNAAPVTRRTPATAPVPRSRRAPRGRSRGRRSPGTET